jgi:hypothetical protein
MSTVSIDQVHTRPTHALSKTLSPQLKAKQPVVKASYRWALANLVSAETHMKTLMTGAKITSIARQTTAIQVEKWDGSPVHGRPLHCPASAAVMSAPEGRTSRPTSCPSRNNTKVGQSLTR